MVVINNLLPHQYGSDKIIDLPITFVETLQCNVSTSLTLPPTTRHRTVLATKKRERGTLNRESQTELTTL